ILPGNDPAVHLAKARIIIMDEKVSYSEIAWYPPLFHTILAIIQIFSGTLDVVASAFVLKLLIATFNVLLMLSTYLFCRKIFGSGVAVVSAVFTILSVPLFEMIFWGGYANFMGLAYIAFVFYILNKNLGVIVKNLLLFLGAFTLVLSHQLTAFVFILFFIPVFLIGAIGSKRRFIAFVAVIVGGGLALLVWYARILIEYSDIIINYIFFAMGENVYHIPAVSFSALIKIFGVTLILGLIGIPLVLIILKIKKTLKDSIQIFFWLAVPFLLAESYLFGIHLPYHRFIYFLATPLAILSAVSIFYIMTVLVNSLEQKDLIKGLVMSLIFWMLFFQAFMFVQRIEPYPKFYERASMSSYDSGLWVKEHSVPDGIVVVSRSPGSWFYLFSDHQTIQETDPLSSRTALAESILYSFYEMDNSRVAIREFDTVSPSAGLAMYTSRFNIWAKTFSIPNNQTVFTYVDPFGKWVNISLSESVESIYWIENSANESKLVSEYTHELFTMERVVTLSDNSSVVNIEWNIRVNKYLALVKLDVINFLESSLDFKEALVPGLLAWQNPWDNPLLRHPNNKWAVVNGPPEILDENLIAALDQTNGVMAVFEFDDYPPANFTLGALNNRVIDALRLHYEFGDLNQDEDVHISYSALTYSFESDDENRRKTVIEVKQLLKTEDYFPVQTRDFNEYIEENNIKFVAVDTKQVLSNIEATPALDRIYDDGRSIVYRTYS
ncbi:MAG: hypothetical protein P8X97_05620, partial [Candidatus Bathyarchaeota archaeon]